MVMIVFEVTVSKYFRLYPSTEGRSNIKLFFLCVGIPIITPIPSYLYDGNYYIVYKTFFILMMTPGSLTLFVLNTENSRAPSQYPRRRLFVRSRKISKRSDNSQYKSRGFETLRDLTERRLFGY